MLSLWLEDRQEKATVGCSIAVIKKAVKVSGSNNGFKLALPRKKRRDSILENSSDDKSVGSKVQNSHSWDSETGDTTESDSIDMEKKCLVEETSFDYALDKPLGKIDFSSSNIDNDVLLDTLLELPPLLKNLVNVFVRKSFTLDIGLDKVVGKFSQEKLQMASTTSKFAGIIRASFTSESSLAQASKKAEDVKILVNTDLKKFFGCSDRAVVVKKIPVRTSAEIVHATMSEFGIIKLIKMQLINYADLVATKWFILIEKNAVHVARSDMDKET
ncbi:hypothetical protein G9A89_017665 [Geosiphon pyriformis]|nr:hypothetical protein G9A89_017665 [Geosiphon pyriformis]